MELEGLDAWERDGKKVILPIWHDLTKEELERYSPMLAGRLIAQTKGGIRSTVKVITAVFGDTAPPVPADYIITDKIVTIQATEDSSIIGHSINFGGFSANCRNCVILFIFGPGKFFNCLKVAHPEISSLNKWVFRWPPDNTILPGYYTITVFDPVKPYLMKL